MNSFVLLMVFMFSQSCSALESDYDKLMSPIKKIKIAEKKAGKKNPTFDGRVEPDFPDEKENSNTLEGVDFNKDGVRDDIEIWINRTAEDQYIRNARKNEYKELFKLFYLFSSREKINEEEITKQVETWSLAGGCLVTLYQPYKEQYLKKHRVNGSQYNTEVSLIAFSNTSIRSRLTNDFNYYQIKGVIGGDSKSYCSRQSFSQEYSRRLENAIKKANKK